MPGLTPTGWEPKRLEDIETEIKNALWANISPQLDLSSTSLLGQFVGTLSSQIAQLWEAAQDIYTGMDPDQAVDDALTSISKITGTTREASAPSTVSCDCNLTAGTYPAGTLIAYVTGDPEARFSNVLTLTPPVSTVYTVQFQALVDGPTEAPAGTLVNIANPVAGFNSITNPADAVLGRYEETNAELRLRREQGLARRGSGTVDAIRADLLAIEAVTEASVRENDGDVVDSYGVPAHGIIAFVLGGADQDIIDTIWASKSPQTATGGSTSGTVIDAQGNSHTVKFQRPSEVTIEINVELEVLSGYQGDIEDKVKTALQNVVGGKVGWDVIYTKCLGAVISLEGVVDVTLLEIGTGGPLSPANVVIDFDEYATIEPANIDVVYTVVSDYP